MTADRTDIEGTDRPMVNWVATGPGNAPIVLLIHPVGYDLTYWDQQIDALCDSYHVIAFDLPGHGRSAGAPQDCTFDGIVAAIVRLLGVAGGWPVHVVGISVGGMIAQTLALTHPALVRSLTLIGTACSFSEAVRSGMRARASSVRAHGMAAVLASSLERWFTPATIARRPDLIERVTRTILADDAAIHAAMWEMIAGFDVEERLVEIDCPTLVLVGDLDPSTPPAAAALLAERIRDARMIVLPKTSHIATLESPAAVNAEMLAFLSAVESQSD